MRELTADLFVSLDHFAGGVDVGAFFGYGGPELDGWVRDHLDRPQVLVMGRVTYQALAAISSPGADDASARMNELPKVVVSGTLQPPLAWRNTRLLRGDLAEVIGALKREPGDPLRSIGSIRLVRSMIRLGLVDRLRLAVFPLTLGPSGREPSLDGYPTAHFELVDTAVLDSRIVVLEYRPRPT